MPPRLKIIPPKQHAQSDDTIDVDMQGDDQDSSDIEVLDKAPLEVDDEDKDEGEDDEEDEEDQGNKCKEEEDEEEEEEDSDELPEPSAAAILKKGRATGKGSRGPYKKKDQVMKEPSVPQEETPPPPRDVLYELAITPYAEYIKTKAKDRKVFNGLLKTSDQLDYAMFRAEGFQQVIKLIHGGTRPVRFNTKRFTIHWRVSRVSKGDYPLNDENDYRLMMDDLVQAKTNPRVKLTMAETSVSSLSKAQAATSTADDTDEENTPQAQDNNPRPNKKVKTSTKKPTVAAIAPGNKAINTKITQLQDRWTCNDAGCKFGSDYCYVGADGQHLPLNNERFEKWAAACLADSAMEDSPPNHPLFDAVSGHSQLSKSRVLQARLAAQANGGKSNTGSTNETHNHFHFSDMGPSRPTPYPAYHHDVFNQHPPWAPPPPTAAPFPFPVPNPVPTASTQRVLPPGFWEGPDMDMKSFCKAHDLSDDILHCFEQEKISGTHAFTELEVSELKEMGFVRGEIIDINRAVKRWAVPRVD
ncbi:hypothetical protein D9758_004253 [Tetrapyrgos nigripes]|uniref:SAM domain-containing protein n=1 Tax=Tetrapyrgos nigripes TaxID=182062 RepID=A0A8H5LVS8_9AGAR|nr:hypothetical protein D9758_004253 [Tetrapyrgos nigripes]